MVFNSEYEDKNMNRKGVYNTEMFVKSTLFDADALNFDDKQAVIISNGRRTDVFKQLRSFISGINLESEMLLFYFCGHGCPNYKKNTLCLAMNDTDFSYASDNSIAAEEINNIIKEYNIQYYAIILDCCHADMHSLGENNGSVLTIKLDDYSELKGSFFIPTSEASGLVETKTIDGKEYLPFSYYFFKILREGIPNEFRRISFKEIYEIVKECLKELNILLPAPTQKGEIFNAALWENLKYRSIDSKYVLEESDDYNDTLNVLFVKSAIDHPIKFEDFGVPLGLWLLKDYIEKYSMDIRIEIYDERLKLQEKEGNQSHKENVLKNFEQVIKNFDVICLSMCSSEVGPALKKLEIAKKQGKITTAGGIFTSSNEQYLLKTGVVDYVTPGIGTTSLRKLLEWLSKQKKMKLKKAEQGHDYQIEKNNEISGVATIDNLNDFFIPTDIVLPNMSLHIWDEIIKKYKSFLYDETLKTYKMDIFSSRGCKGTCTFCSVQKECGRKISMRSEKSLIDEVKYLYEKGFHYFSLKDENCLSDQDRFMRFLNNVQFPDIKFKIRTRVDHLLDNFNLLQTLSELGVVEIQYGIESSDYTVLNGVNKGISKKNIEKITSFIKAHAKFNIIANCSFILGLAGENEEYYDELLSFIKVIYDNSNDCKPKIYINFLSPHPIDSKFPIPGDYKMITNDLNYFTHKFPIGFYEHENGIIIRQKMIDTYEEIIEYTKSQKYNPSLKASKGYEHLEKFIYGNKYILTNPQLPNYCKGE